MNKVLTRELKTSLTKVLEDLYEAHAKGREWDTKEEYEEDKSDYVELMTARLLEELVDKDDKCNDYWTTSDFYVKPSVTHQDKKEGKYYVYTGGKTTYFDDFSEGLDFVEEQVSKDKVVFLDEE